MRIQTEYGRFFCGRLSTDIMHFATQSSTVNIRDSKTSYAMYPVWLLNTTWKGQKYTFAMNGQSGKIVGDLPADEGAFWKYVGTRGILISVILYIIMMVVMFFVGGWEYERK